MENETTMPGLLTLPAALSEASGNARPRGLYTLVFAAAVLILAGVYIFLP